MWDLGQIIGSVVLIVLTGGCVVGVKILRFNYENGDDYDNFLLNTSRGVYALAGALVIVMVLSWFPYEKEYFYWSPTGGEVTSIESRLMADGEGMTENFVVTFAGEDQQYRCDDTRCALVKPGDTLMLNCKRDWQWASTHGYECRFDSHMPRGAS
jgi:hypothetical protein